MAKNSAASWTTQDEVNLLNFLVEHASAAGDGGNFKSATFQAAMAVLNQKPAKCYLWCSCLFMTVQCSKLSFLFR